jgi:hypothetical protein
MPPRELKDDDRDFRAIDYNEAVLVPEKGQ